MELVHDSSFVVYVRADRRHEYDPEMVERPLAACATYADARRIQQFYRQSDQECVIRYEGVSGGGD
jgi:hypothetical protein